MARELLQVMGINAQIPIVAGSEGRLANVHEVLESEGAKAIVNEAMRDDKRPLYILCGAGLTNIASAYLMEPRIAEHIQAVVWIGGPEYPDLCRNQYQKQKEYNLAIDLVSVQTVFNHSTLNIWRIPRDVYRQALYSYAELLRRIGQSGETGAYLMSRLAIPFSWSHGQLGEAYVLGDSPLVLVTALQSSWESDAATCEYVTRPIPVITDFGQYKDNPDGRPIRIFTRLDTRLMIEDFVSKLYMMKGAY